MKHKFVERKICIRIALRLIYAKHHVVRAKVSPCDVKNLRTGHACCPVDEIVGDIESADHDIHSKMSVDPHEGFFLENLICDQPCLRALQFLIGKAVLDHIVENLKNLTQDNRKIRRVLQLSINRELACVHVRVIRRFDVRNKIQFLEQPRSQPRRPYSPKCFHKDVHRVGLVIPQFRSREIDREICSVDISF